MIKHQQFNKRKTALKEGYIYDVVVPWKNGQGSFWWNETCIKVLEVFGLPGGRYTAHPEMDKMTFAFGTAEDQFICKILLSDRI